MRSFLISLVLLITFSMKAKASGYFGDVEAERKFLDMVILTNASGLHACIELSNGSGMHAKGEINILMILAPGESRPRAASAYNNQTGRDELAACFVRRFEAAEITLPDGMYMGPYIIRLNIVEENASMDFSSLAVRDPRPLDPYSSN